MTRTYRSEKSTWWTKIKETFMLISSSKLRVKKGLCCNIPVVNITILNVKFDNLSYFPNSEFHIPIYSFFHFHMFSLSSFKPGLFILKALSTRLKSFIPFYRDNTKPIEESGKAEKLLSWDFYRLYHFSENGHFCPVFTMSGPSSLLCLVHIFA